MNEEKIVYILGHKVLLPEFFPFLCFKEHNVIKLMIIFDAFYAYYAKHNDARFNHNR